VSQAFRLQGQVLDESQRPVADAQVLLDPGRHAVTSDPDGKFALADLQRGRFTLTAYKGELCSVPLIVRPEDSESATLHMRLGLTLIVRVSAGRAPVAGAKLVVGQRSTNTDANGTATIRGLATHSYQGWLRVDGCADERLFFSVHEDPGGVIDLAIELSPGARIEGVVIGPGSEPVSDVHVMVCGENDGTVPYNTSSDADGKWGVVARAGTYRIRAQSRDRRHAELALECDGLTQQRDVVLRLGPPPAMGPITSIANVATRLLTGEKPNRLAGVVVDETGQPLIGAHVALTEPSQRGGSIMKWGGETDGRGRFDVDGLESSEFDVSARWPRQQSSTRDPSPALRVRTGDTNIRIELTRSAAVRGRVLLDGHPLPYFGVSLTPQGVFGGSPIGFRSSVGRFALPHVAPGIWQIGVIGPGTGLKIVDQIAIADRSGVDLGDIEMERGHRIVGRVFDQAGAPAIGARVIVGHWGRLGSSVRSRLEGWFMRHYEVTTGDDGAYEFEGIAAHLAWPRAPQIWAEYGLSGDSLIRDVSDADTSIDLSLLGTGKIEGVVEGLRGGHVIIVVAVRADEPDHARMASVGKDGRFRFDVPSGDYVVRLSLPDAEAVAPVNVAVVTNQIAKVTLIMSTSSVRLTVIVPPGRGKDLVIEPKSAGAAINGRGRSTMGMGSEDRCSFDFVRPGDYRLSLDGNAWTTVSVGSSPTEQTIDFRKL
jgi:protocatechuate 3,4-dioxygenase beta subunit